MRHSDIVWILESGPAVRPKTLEPLGIYGDSVCWGFWVVDSMLGHLPTDDFEPSDDSHLLISPVHPSLWPFMFRLSLELKHEKGALARAAKVLLDEEVNIVSTSAAPSGYRYATWNVIGEAVAVKSDLGLPETPDQHLEVARRILDFLSNLENRLKEANKEEEFLNHHLASGGFICSFREEDLESERWGRHREQIASAIRWRATSQGMYLARCLQESGYRPVEFSYDAKSGTLLSRDWSTSVADLAIQLPTRAVASINSEEMFLRLQLLRQRRIRSIVTIDLGYETTNEKGPVSSMGLVAKVAEVVRDHDLSLLTVSNTLEEFRHRREKGSVRIRATADGPLVATEILEEAIREIEPPVEGLRVTEVRLRPFHAVRIFVSVNNLDDGHLDDLTSTLYAAASDIGLAPDQLVFRKSHTEDVTEGVRRDIDGCTGFLQIARMIRARDRKTPWLVAEYAMAVALGKPRIRIVELGENDTVDRAWWKEHLALEQDRQDATFCRLDGGERVWVSFRDALRDLVERIVPAGG